MIDAAFSEDVLERRQNSPLVAVGEDRALVLRVTVTTGRATSVRKRERADSRATEDSADA